MFGLRSNGNKQKEREALWWMRRIQQLIDVIKEDIKKCSSREKAQKEKEKFPGCYWRAKLKVESLEPQDEETLTKNRVI